MDRIEINRGCFEESITIDGEDLLNSPVHKFQVFLHLYNIVEKLDFEEWEELLYLIFNNSEDFKELEEESLSFWCDSCGDYNYNYVYTKREE